MGWEPRVELVPTDTGGFVVEREPEWDQGERDLMSGLDQFESQYICPVCGGLLSECTDPENERAYTIDTPIRCHRQTALVQFKEKYKESPVPEALMFRARLKE